MAKPIRYIHLAHKAIKSPEGVTLDFLNDLSSQQLRELGGVIGGFPDTPKKVRTMALIREELERARIHEARPSLFL